jgi:hypothetical protein
MRLQAREWNGLVHTKAYYRRISCQSNRLICILLGFLTSPHFPAHSHMDVLYPQNNTSTEGAQAHHKRIRNNTLTEGAQAHHKNDKTTRRTEDANTNQNINPCLNVTQGNGTQTTRKQIVFQVYDTWSRFRMRESSS